MRISESRNSAGAITCGVVLAVVLYCVAYLAALRNPGTRSISITGGTMIEPVAEYSHPAFRHIFAPAHQIDRLVRRRYWAPRPSGIKQLRIRLH